MGLAVTPTLKIVFRSQVQRCSAADAKRLRELRESKKYKLLGLTWEECCKQRAGIGRSTADQIIQNLEEFGPGYFVIAQVTGISATGYRRIRGAVCNHTLLHGGEVIPIEVEHAPRLAAAVGALRRENVAPHAAAIGPADVTRCLGKAERALRTALDELEEVSAMTLDAAVRMRLQSAIGETADRLKLMQVKW